MVVKNKKMKRLLKSEDDGVPKKVAKVYAAENSSNEIDEKSELESEQVETMDAENTLPEDSITFSRDFKMMNFRTKLRGTDFIPELRNFLHISEKNPRIIVKYIEKRGKPLELAEAMDRIDKTNLNHISYLCEALQKVLLQIVTSMKEHLESAAAASRYFLKKHGSFIEKLIKSPNDSHRRCVLKLLTAIVCIEPQLGRELLTSFDILSNPKSINNMLLHSKSDKNSEDTVRKAFIHFALAYMVEGNTVLIRNILDKSQLIKVLISGLFYDDHVTICVVLNTLKKYVLECPEISKTKKIHVFDVECVKSLIRLFSWPEAESVPGKQTGKETFAETTNNEGEKESVYEVLHDFLVVLLTSRKYGIAFDAMINFRQKRNLLQGKIVTYTKFPWLHPLKIDLIVRILKACPEYARQTIKHYSNYINPFKSTEKHWISIVNFVCQLISEMHPSIMKSAIDQITLTDYTFWIKDICLSSEVLFHLKNKNVLKSPKYTKRVAATRLLFTMYKQYCNYVNAIMEREKYKGNEMRRFKFDILNHLFINFPTVENILLSLNLSIKQHSDEDIDIQEHLEITLDLILMICEHNRNFVDRTGTIIDFLNVLRPLYAKGNIQIEMKAIKTMLILVPGALKPSKKLFQEVIHSFVNAFLNGSGEIQKEAYKLLHDIFLNTGLFENSVLEIHIWLQALKFIDIKSVEMITDVFVEVLNKHNAMIQLPKDDNMCHLKNLAKLFENIENGLSVEGYTETITISKLMPMIIQGVEIVEKISSYLEIVFLLLFHYLPSPKSLYLLCKHELKMFKQYTKSWIEKGKPGVLNSNAIPHYDEIYNAILKGEMKFFDIFGNTVENECFHIEFKANKQESINKILLNETLLMFYIEEIIFIVSNLTQLELLSDSQSLSAANFLCHFLDILKYIDDKNVEKMSLSSITNKEKAPLSSLEQILKYIFYNHPDLLQNFNIFANERSTALHLLAFICNIKERANKYKSNTFENFTINYRLKIIKQIEAETFLKDGNSNRETLKAIMRALEVFNMSVDDCMEIIYHLCSLEYKQFCDVNGQKSVYLEILIFSMNRIHSFKCSVTCTNELIQKLTNIYINLIKDKDNETNLEKFDEAFYNLLQISHQLISEIPKALFLNIFNHPRITKSTVRFACLLLQRNDKLNSSFIKILLSNMSKKELVYPLLNVLFQKNVDELNQELLNSIYQEYKNGFIKTIEKPQKAGVIYKENCEASIYLIEKCMPVSECLDFCKKNFKFDVVEGFQARAILAIYKKAINSLNIEKDQTTIENIFIQFLNIIIQMFSIVLKRDAGEISKTLTLSFIAYEWIKINLDQCRGCSFEKVLNSSNWMNFCKNALRLGMLLSFESVPDGGIVDEKNGSVLKILAYLCDVFYVNEENNSEAGQLFEMVFSHSKFLDLVLSQQRTKVKTEIMHLLCVLAQKNKLVLNEKQVPILLGAYQAKLSNCDRYTLALIQLYEMNGINLSEFRPFIWGESAIAFYSLRGNDETLNLEHHDTSVLQVMSLIDKQSSDYTLLNFPIWRRLNALNQLPEISFENPDSLSMHFGNNCLEEIIESGQLDIDSALLRICPKRKEVYDDCYDPAFIIPLMTMCFSPEMYSHPVQPIQNGLLAIVFGALSSQDKEMRMAAGLTQMRYRQHFESNKFYDKPVWIQAYDNIQNGLETLRADWVKHKNSGVPRVPFVSGLFLATTINIIIDPTHPMYKTVIMYLRLKEAFNFLCVPEFNVLFHSHEVEQNQYRQFIVEIIRDGIKCSSDLFLLISTNTFKALLGFYNSTMSSRENNLIILSTISTCVKIPATSKIMIEHVGIIPWLSSIINSIEYFHFDTIEGVITIINNLWYSIKATEKQFYNFQHYESAIYRLLIKLLPNLTGRISFNNFAKFLNILRKTAHASHKAVTEAQLDNLINCMQKHCENYVCYIENIKKHGSSGAESTEMFCCYLKNSNLDSVSIMALSSLREFVIKWSTVI